MACGLGMIMIYGEVSADEPLALLGGRTDLYCWMSWSWCGNIDGTDTIVARSSLPTVTVKAKSLVAVSSLAIVGHKTSPLFISEVLTNTRTQQVQFRGRNDAQIFGVMH